jgi:transposase
MRTVFNREDPETSHIVYNRTLLAFPSSGYSDGFAAGTLASLARHYGYPSRACNAYRAKTKGKVERPFRYIGEDFFLGRDFRNLDDVDTQFRQWLDRVANVRTQATSWLSISPRSARRFSR